MGEDSKLSTLFYAIVGSDEEMKPLGKTELNLIDEESKIPKYAEGGIKNKCVAFAEVGENGFSGELELIVTPKTMKKKRFIKLIMSKGYQRNKANKIHQEYMEKYKYRTMIGLMVFLECYNIKPIFKLKIGEKIFEGEMRYEKGNDISSR